MVIYHAIHQADHVMDIYLDHSSLMKMFEPRGRMYTMTNPVLSSFPTILTSQVSTLTSSVSALTSPVSTLTSPVSALTSPVSTSAKPDQNEKKPVPSTLAKLKRCFSSAFAKDVQQADGSPVSKQRCLDSFVSLHSFKSKTSSEKILNQSGNGLHLKSSPDSAFASQETYASQISDGADSESISDIHILEDSVSQGPPFNHSWNRMTEDDDSPLNVVDSDSLTTYGQHNDRDSCANNIYLGFTNKTLESSSNSKSDFHLENRTKSLIFHAEELSDRQMADDSASNLGGKCVISDGDISSKHLPSAIREVFSSNNTVKDGGNSESVKEADSRHKFDETVAEGENLNNIQVTQKEVDQFESVKRKEHAIPFSMSDLKEMLQKRRELSKEESGEVCRKFRATISPTDNTTAEEELKKEIRLSFSFSYIIKHCKTLSSRWEMSSLMKMFEPRGRMYTMTNPVLSSLPTILTSPVSTLTSPVSTLTSSVSTLTSPVSALTSSVSTLTSPTSAKPDQNEKKPVPSTLAKLKRCFSSAFAKDVQQADGSPVSKQRCLDSFVSLHSFKSKTSSEKILNQSGNGLHLKSSPDSAFASQETYASQISDGADSESISDIHILEDSVSQGPPFNQSWNRMTEDDDSPLNVVDSDSLTTYGQHNDRDSCANDVYLGFTNKTLESSSNSKSDFHLENRTKSLIFHAEELSDRQMAEDSASNLGGKCVISDTDISSKHLPSAIREVFSSNNTVKDGGNSESVKEADSRHKFDETVAEGENLNNIQVIQKEVDQFESVKRKEHAIPFSMSDLKEMLQKRRELGKEESGEVCRKFRATISPTDNTTAEEELKKEIRLIII
ncbi:uncharacterized protein LOC106179657 [Lingula anatina]|uniref:Uncharacterized protein LOC106179657 n=1 Tax=Lingula anatina TaxID=7574 RepID=A0A1S3K881_LINAN|nr:uncharacterized protein LOC106179657 [Lingula anatina]|eukprot:XP_013418833.1 uncharacterized protein LOC106179657 [Lingula anatina]